MSSSTPSVREQACVRLRGPRREQLSASLDPGTFRIARNGQIIPLTDSEGVGK
jgi:hypothetical protein